MWVDINSNGTDEETATTCYSPINTDNYKVRIPFCKQFYSRIPPNILLHIEDSIMSPIPECIIESHN